MTKKNKTAFVLAVIVIDLIISPLASLSAAQTGIASWYSKKGPGIKRYTANGELFDDRKLTCAAWNYSFGTRLRVENLKNGKSVVCRVNDRGPHKRLRRRKIDLTQAAFRRIADSRLGLVRVSITKISD